MTIKALTQYSDDELLAETLRRGILAQNDGTFLSALRAANLSRVTRFGHTLSGWNAMQWGCALVGEMGELAAEIGALNRMALIMTQHVGGLANEAKKYVRQMPTDPTPDEQIAKIGDELADVFIYGDLTAAYFSMDLARIISNKFNRTSKKFGFPERL